MENNSSESPLPPNYVTIKDLQERWLKRGKEQQQQLQGEQLHAGKEKDKKQQQQPESRSPSRSLHTECVNRGEENNSAGRVWAGGEVGKPGRTPWEPWVRFSGPGRRDGDRKPESGRWWSSKERRENAGVEANKVGGGANSRQEEGCGDSGSSVKGVGDQPVSKSQNLVVENVVGAAGTGVSTPLEQEAADGKNAQLMKGVKDESGSNYNYMVEEKGIEVAIGGRKKPPKEKPCERVSPGNGVQDKPRPESNSLHVDKRAGTGAEVALNGAKDELPDEASRMGVLSRKGVRDWSRSESKSAVVENGEVVAGDGQALLEGAAGEGVLLKKGWKSRSWRKKKSKVVGNGVTPAKGYGKDLLEGATGKSVPLGKGMRDESRSKDKNMVKENQMAVVEVSSSEGLKDENKIRSRSMPMGSGKVAGGGELVPPEEVARESATAKSKSDKKRNRKGKNKKDVYGESMTTEVEAGPRVRDVICVNLAHEIEEQFHNMSTEDNDRSEGGCHPVRMDRGGYRRDSRKGIHGRRKASNQIGGEMVWVKKGETAAGGGSWHSIASLELLK